jgi:hypothetical protein
MSGSHRGFWEDVETGRRGFFGADHPMPDGPMVEEITAREFYEREAKVLACGWPKTHHERSADICACGFLQPAGVPEDHWHTPVLSAEDDEALS